MLSKSIYFFYDFAKDEKQLTTTKKEQNMIHHIVSLNFFSLNEIDNVDKIRQIDPLGYEYRYYIFNTFENLKIAELDSTEQSQAAVSIKRDIKNDTNILLTFDNCKLIYLDSNLKALSCSRKYIYLLVEFYRYLLRSIILLVDAGIVHNNIHFNTIVVNSFDKPLLTNFMYSIDLNKYTDLASMAAYIKHFVSRDIKDYYRFPIEFCILNYQLTNKLECLSIYNIETIVRQFVKDHTILNSFGSKVVQTYLDNGIQYFSKYANKSYQQNVADMLKHSSTWDNYALSIVYLKILIGLHRVVKTNNKFIILFMKLLVENINLDPSKRQSLNLTNERFEQMLRNIELIEFQLLVNLL
jgi:hypothetical protein